MKRPIGVYSTQGEESVGRKTIKRGPGQLHIKGKDFQLADEIRYIQRRAAEHDGREWWRRVVEALRWRGPLRFLLLVVRETLRPAFYWHVYYIVENDLRQQLPVPYAKRPFEVRIYSREKGLAAIEPQLTAMGELTPEEVHSRARHGDLVGVAYAGAEPVGYSWMSCSSGLPLAFDATWIVHPNEAVLYGSFVRHEWRGQGIHSCLDVALNSYAREHGIVRTIGSMAVYNSQTLALAKHTGKRKVMIVALARIRGINRTWGMALGAPLNSHFRLPGRA